MSWEQRNADFCNAQTDAQLIYIEAERRVAELEEQNAKLRGLLADLAICACGKYCYGCPHQYDGCDRDQRLRELGVDA